MDENEENDAPDAYPAHWRTARRTSNSIPAEDMHSTTDSDTDDAYPAHWRTH